ncbi:MAG: PQQ-dependent dehydrogenase, methanol/ethanol family [Acidobacteriota bacterium]|nr:PQQ-dependent dehydrogenase, methanol/ethanol family [Acidobacteriota bacterium]
MGVKKCLAIATTLSLVIAWNILGSAQDAGQVDGTRIAAADAEPGEWLSYGRTYDEQRFSPLDQINAENVDELGLAWFYDTGQTRGHEATPLVVDGRIYVTASWSVVHAVDATTGEEIWTFDPEVPREWARWVCCDVVNRGAAIWEGRVYVGTLDGRLIAIDADTGEADWEVRTTDPEKPYAITGAPRIVRGKVIIGNGGAEYGVRGYVSAYDAETGEQAWRFYTVPGDPSQPFEHPEMETAAETWTGEWWRMGGGGTVWDSMAYDPELNLLYVGVGNGAPWTRIHRSPGGGDNLYLSSILALRPETGELIWHYQTTPADNWDYTAVQHIMLADLEIDGITRQVLMQAPKNGFFYVIDRATGELISAEKYITATWASHVDMATGRPVETPAAIFEDQPQLLLPGPLGGHNWHPMAFNPDTGLVYIPTIDVAFHYSVDDTFQYDPRTWNLGVSLSNIPDLLVDMPAPPSKGFLKAWNPVTQTEAWTIEHPAAYNGGLLSTAGNLVFQGTADGRLAAYTADSGEKLWELPINIGIVAPPITYSIDGQQYLAVLAGWGGGGTILDAGLAAASHYENLGRLLVFRLGATAPVPPVTPKTEAFLAPTFGADLTETEERGQDLFHDTGCAICHGLMAVSSGTIPDLRQLDETSHQRFDAVVRGGILRNQGMPSYADLLTEGDVAAIQVYLQRRTADDTAASQR